MNIPKYWLTLFRWIFRDAGCENQIEKATISEQSDREEQQDIEINGYNFSHLLFLESVIDLGIEKALRTGIMMFPPNEWKRFSKP